MLLQRAGTGTRPPAGFVHPPWEVLSSQWSNAPLPSTSTVVLGPSDIILGHNDSEALDKLPSHLYDVQDHVFGWDNESPARTVHVQQFKAEWRPVTNGEFASFILEGKGKGIVSMPKSWVQDDDGWCAVAYDQQVQVCAAIGGFDTEGGRAEEAQVLVEAMSVELLRV